MKLYAASITGHSKAGTATVINTLPISFLAENDNEAYGIAYNHCLKHVYPVNQGFYNQGVSILAIPADQIIMAANIIESENE